MKVWLYSDSTMTTVVYHGPDLTTDEAFEVPDQLWNEYQEAESRYNELLSKLCDIELASRLAKDAA
jgi:hypothetical protein